MKSLNNVSKLMILAVLQLGLAACGPGLETAGMGSSSLTELQLSLDKAQDSLLTLASESPDLEGNRNGLEGIENKTDEEIIADFRQRLVDMIASIESRVERLEQDGIELPQGIANARESVLAQLEETIARLDEDQEFRDQIVERARRAATMERPEFNREKACEHLERMLSGDLSRLPEGAREHLQRHYEKTCTETVVTE